VTTVGLPRVLASFGISIALLCGVPHPSRGANFEEIKESYNRCTASCEGQFGDPAVIEAECCSIRRCSDTCMSVYTLFFATCLDGCANVILSGDIDPVAALADGGRRVDVGGPLECNVGFQVQELTVTVTQQRAPAAAVGKWKGDCSGRPGHWDTVAAVHGAGVAGLRPGPARICAVAEFAIGGQAAEAKQWCQDVTLLPEGTERAP
jgi:hypothetical protein